MQRFFQLWQTRLALMTLAVLTGMVTYKFVQSRTRTRVPDVPDPARVQAWDKVTARLQDAEQRDSDSCARQLQQFHDYFANKRARTPEFADDLLGWGGKWQFVKGKLTNDNGRAYQAFLRETFERHFFSEQDLKELTEGTLKAFLTELEGEENALLVEIRADLNEQGLPQPKLQAILQTDEAFRTAYRGMLDQVVPTVSRDLQVTVGKEVGVWVASEVATVITVRLGTAVATRLGVSGGILGTGAASGIATFGLGLVVGFVADAVVDQVMRHAGYDPAAEIARQAANSLDRMEDALVHGNRHANEVYERLRSMQDRDSFPFVREECGRNADRIAASGTLGLRQEMIRLQQLRSRLREAALKKLVLEGGRS